MPQKYRVTTDQGVFEVTVDDTPTVSAVASSEPDTFMGGAVKGLKDYAANVGPRMANAFVDAFNLPKALAGKESADQQAGAELQQMLTTGKAEPRQPWTLGRLKTLAQNSIDQAPETAGSLAGAYVLGKATNLAGQGMQKLAPKVMDTGLWRSGAQRMEFPNTPQRLVDEGIIPSTPRVQQALGQAEATVNAKAARQAGPWSRRVLPSQMADQAEQFATTEGKVPGLGNVPGPETADIANQKAQYLAQNTRARDLPETIAQKRAYAARTSYNPRPNAPTQTNESVNFNKGIAAANREAAIRMDRSLEADLAREQDLLGAKQALGYTDVRGTPLTVGGITRHTLMLPQPLGVAAIGLDRLGGALAHPTLLRALLLQALTGGASGATGASDQSVLAGSR